MKTKLYEFDKNRKVNPICPCLCPGQDDDCSPEMCKECDWYSIKVKT